MDTSAQLNRVEDFSFINPLVKYFLFVFSFLFWIVSLLMIGLGIYAKMEKATDTVWEAFFVDPAIILIVVGVIMFFITFCGCTGALRENIVLLKAFSISLTMIFLLQLAIAVLGFVYSSKARAAANKFMKKAIAHYRDDPDLQNLIDYIQKQFQCCGWNNYTDWSKNLYFNCTPENPSREKCGVPYSCCITIPIETVINTMCGYGTQNLGILEASKLINPEGCAYKAADYIKDHFFLVGALVLGLALPQVAGIILSWILISQIYKEMETVF
ncbi:tetraspanin-33-like [Protopterus annectens]|uniref:tetraspanin-33-like n=1 Tax=Protopterus annectens TaxID=7888 RepID=UPI001CFAE84C|nr:tetraspanin-33-like [Protopterus annectens]